MEDAVAVHPRFLPHSLCFVFLIFKIFAKLISRKGRKMMMTITDIQEMNAISKLAMFFTPVVFRD
ncbi:hypothetical protein LguiA_035743 [Lonicera macranthoides]